MTSIITTILLLADAFQLGDSIFNMSKDTYLTKDSSYEQAEAAIEASTPDIPPEILLSIAWLESRYSPYATSRIESGSRVIGIPTWKIPPKGTKSFFCGVTQATAGDSWERCKQLREIKESYKDTVAELQRWMSPKLCGQDLKCALAGYSGGVQMIKAKNFKYGITVMSIARLIRNKAKRVLQPG